jgi:hypothetical protein
MKCILTGKDVPYERRDSHISYTLNIANNEADIFICSHCKDKIKLNAPFYIIEGLIANKKWPVRSFIISETCTQSNQIVDSETIILPNFLQTAEYPKTPKEKLEHLFINLFNRQTYDGESFEIKVKENDFLLKNYFQNIAECAFYINGLQDKGLIHYKPRISDGSVGILGMTHLGLNKAIELMEEGDKSKNCFIAMSFDTSTKAIRETIRQALDKTGYKAIIIDEQIIDSERTINDEIIASLKRCKFCIADFSLHSKGVYFESGFALGQGKKVIYTCSKIEFEKAHFDIKPLQHIIYETTEQLKKDLISKIEAYIN